MGASDNDGLPSIHNHRKRIAKSNAKALMTNDLSFIISAFLLFC